MARETIEQSVLNQWKGVNQRLQPTTVPDGFFTMCLGVYFGLGDNAERIPGKTVMAKVTGPVVNIYGFGKFAILQLKDSVVMITN